MRLLIEEDPIEAARIAAELDRLNRERQTIEVETVAQAEAEAMAALGIEETGAVVVTAAEGWHPGVVGLVAARLKEKFGRPAFAIALEPGGVGTGSGRSIPGVDIGRAVRRAVAEGLIEKGGGHAMAAGVTLPQERAGAAAGLPRSNPRSRWWRSRGARNGLLIDGAISAAAADAGLVALIERAGPFGSGNPEPVIALPGAYDRLCRGGRPGAHAGAAQVADGAGVNAIAFRAGGQKLGAALLQNRGRQVHAAGTFALNPLAGRGARTVPPHRYRAGGAVCGAVNHDLLPPTPRSGLRDKRPLGRRCLPGRR